MYALINTGYLCKAWYFSNVAVAGTGFHVGGSGGATGWQAFNN